VNSLTRLCGDLRLEAINGVVACSGRERGALQLLGQVHRSLEDVVSMGHQAVGQARKPPDPQGIEPGRGGKMGVQVRIFALRPDDRRSEGSQRPDGLLRPPARAVDEVTQAAERVPGGQAYHGPQAPAERHIVQVGHAQAAVPALVGGRRANARLYPDRMPVGDQRGALRHDEGLG